MRICFVGAGYVGLVTGTCFADLGNNVICVDNNEEKINTLKSGGIPIYEPGLNEMIERNINKNRLSFTTSITEGVESSDIIFIAVNTPPLPDGEADLSFVENVSKEIAQTMTSRQSLPFLIDVHPSTNRDWDLPQVTLVRLLNQASSQIGSNLCTPVSQITSDSSPQ